jgi:hypothetical protein
VSASSEGEYVGRSSEERAEPSLEAAIRNAYRQAIDAKPKDTGETFRFRITDIYVEGTNPPTDYVVHLTG